MITGTLIHTWLHGRLVGTDEAGNRYYEDKRGPTHGGRRRRWVMYKGAIEGSQVPPEWHAWLHYTTPEPLKAEDRPWERDHQPNLSGTAWAYVPPGDDRRGGERDRATGDYEPWQPA